MPPLTLLTALLLAPQDECVASLLDRSRRLPSLNETQLAAFERIAEETGQTFEAVKKVREIMVQVIPQTFSGK